MTKPLILIFAYHYPPENAIGSARPFRFVKYLSRMGYTCRVFTAADQTGRDDPNAEYVSDPFLNRSRRSLNWQLERALRKLFLPGELGMQWSFYASRAARAYLNAHPNNCVTLFSTFPPLGPHLAAWQLARSEHLPWIADFRDPFPEKTENNTRHSYQMRFYRWLERVTARRASAIIANTDAALLRWREKFPSLDGRVHSIWNGFDAEERVEPLPATSGDFRMLSHAGELYGGRTATPILESIERLIHSGRLSSQRMRVRLIGTTEPDALPSQEFLARARAKGWLELVTKTIPKSEALRIARSSDALLLLQLRTAVQVPAKLFEYIQIGRPILAFVQPDSPSERVLAQSGVPYRCVYPDSPPQKIDEIVADFFTLPSTEVAPSPWFEEQFNAENQTRQLDAIIKSLHKEPVRATEELPSASVAPTHSPSNQEIGISEEAEEGSINLVHPS